jgi:hypothetical protein
MKGQVTNDGRAFLPRRTGRANNPHPALARIVSSRKHLQPHQFQMAQVRIQPLGIDGFALDN